MASFVCLAVISIILDVPALAVIFDVDQAGKSVPALHYYKPD